MNDEDGAVFGEFPEETGQLSPASLDFEADQRRRRYTQVLLSYDELRTRLGSLREARNKILRYFLIFISPHGHWFCDTCIALSVLH